MTTRIAAVIFGLLFAAAAGAQTVTIAAPPAGSEQATTMPDDCSQLDVNCVLDDGPARQAVVGAFVDRLPGTTPAATAAAGGMAEGSAAAGAMSSGRAGTARR